jgi:Bacterial dnaA protein helix-turn-helix
MTPLQAELHSARQARLARMGAWQRNEPVVPIERVLRAESVVTIPEPQPLPPSLPAPEPMKVETWFRMVEESPPQRLRVEHIQQAVALHFKIRREDLLSSRRTANLITPRHAAVWLAKRLTTKSLPEIGRRFGGRDHTTVLHAIRKTEQKIAAYPSLAAELAELETRLKALAEKCCPACGAPSLAASELA